MCLVLADRAYEPLTTREIKFSEIIVTVVNDYRTIETMMIELVSS